MKFSSVWCPPAFLEPGGTACAAERRAEARQRTHRVVQQPHAAAGIGRLGCSSLGGRGALLPLPFDDVSGAPCDDAPASQLHRARELAARHHLIQCAAGDAGESCYLGPAQERVGHVWPPIEFAGSLDNAYLSERYRPSNSVI